MEKETKNILIGAGALAALYILFNKYKKDVINKPIGNNKVVSNEPVPEVPIETAPVLPSEPVAVIPIQPSPVLPVEPAPFEPLPIFTNPIDDFINPVVPVEPVVALPVEPVIVLPVEPVFAAPIEISTADQFVFNIVQPQEDYTNINKVESVINDLNLIEDILNKDNKSSDDINALNEAIVNVEAATNDTSVANYLDNNNVNYDVSNEKAYVEEVIAEKNKIVEIANVSYIVGNEINKICNHPYYTGLGDEQSGLQTLYFRLDYWNPITRENPIGYVLYEDNNLTIPYTKSRYVTRWGTAERVLELDYDGTIINVLPACKMEKIEVVKSSFIIGNETNQICNHPYYTGLGDDQSGIVFLHFRKDYWNPITRENPIGYVLYEDGNLTIPYTKSRYVTRWGTAERVLELDNNGTIINVLPACQMKKIEVGRVSFVVNNDVYNLCQDPYFGGNGSASEVVTLYINLAEWSRLSNNTIGLKLYKDGNLSTPWTDTKYMVRWGNRDLPVFEINQNTGEIISVMSPCYVINAENK